MEGSYQLKCQICFVLVDSSKYESVKSIVIELLDVLLLKLDGNRSNKGVICNHCLNKIENAFQFKATCLYTEDLLFPYINVRQSVPVDLRAVYLKEKKSEELATINEKLIICRLCMNLIEYSPMHLLEAFEKRHLTDIFIKFVPEVAINSVPNPQICNSCLTSFQNFADFIISYFPNETLNIEPNEVIAKAKNNNLPEFFLKNGSDDIKSSRILCELQEDKLQEEMRHETDLQQALPQNCPNSNDELSLQTQNTMKSYKCKNCQFVSNRNKNFKQHKTVCDRKRYQCKICLYRTKSQQYLKKHILLHSGKTRYKCTICTFSTNYKRSFKIHLLRHENPDALETFSCYTCPFQTKCKSHLVLHVFTHKNPVERQTFKCKLCKFETKRKDSLKQHMVKHDLERYQCLYCEFSTKHHRSLKPHMMTHLNVPESQLLCCPFCEYKNKFRKNLNAHMLKHDTSHTFECFVCDYVTNRKDCLAQHLVSHDNSIAAKIYRCSLCPYSSKWRASLSRHVIQHQTQTYKCDICPFETKYKNFLPVHVAAHSKVRKPARKKIKKRFS